MRTWTPLFASVLLAAVSVGCGGDEDRYSDLKKVRVLAIKSEPVVPAPGEETVLTPLVYLPPGETPTFAWSWCPIQGSSTNAYECPVTPDELGMLLPPGPMGEKPSLDLGTGETAKLRVSVAREILQALCAGTAGGAPAPAGGAGDLAAQFRPNCDGGFPVNVKLIVTSSSGESVTSVRTLKLRLEDRHANANPELQALNVVVGGAEQPLDVMNMPPGPLPRSEKFKLKVRLNEGVSEPFMERDERDQLIPARERLFLTWFVESGDLDEERTAFIDGRTPFEKLLENEWETPIAKDFERDTVRIFVVARDNRGGVSWRFGSARIGGAP